MFDNRLRQLKDSILTPLAASPLGRLRPNQVTTVGFLVGLGALVPLYYGRNGLAFALWAANRVIDGLDGLIARRNKTQSDFGGYYDILTDFVLYALIPGVIALRERSLTLSFLTILLLGVFYVNGASWMYLSGLLEKQRRREEDAPRTTSLEMPRGVIEGTETIVFYSLFILLPGGAVYLVALMSLLTALGIPQRLIFARKHLS